AHRAFRRAGRHRWSGGGRRRRLRVARPDDPGRRAACRAGRRAAHHPDAPPAGPQPEPVRHLRTPTGRAVTIVVAALSGALLTALLLPDRTASNGFTFGRPETTGLPREVLAAGHPEGSTTRQPPTTRPSGRPSALPRLLSIPRLGLRMLARPRGVDDRGAMALPTSASMVGWYRFGSRPLDRAGATVLAGHVDTRADGVGAL